MKAIQIQWMPRVASAALCLLALTGCGPSEKQLAARAEATRIDCLDKICYGDVAPKIDNTKDAVLKLNGQWYVGPKQYFTSSGARGFIWWKRKPLTTVESRPPELAALIADGKGYDFSIEIFLTGRQSWPTPNVEKPWEARGWEAQFEKLVKDGLKISRQQVRPDLEVVTFVKADGKPYDTTFYIATKQKNMRGADLPGISCLSVTETCSTGDFWQDDVYARLRFHIKHAQDWPAIHQEVIRVLNLAKKVQS